jgi:hypothetical protein
LSLNSTLKQDTIKQLNELSNLNSVWFYRNELLNINKEYSNMSNACRRRFVEIGIIYETYSKHHSHTFDLTDKGRNLLKDLNLNTLT